MFPESLRGIFSNKFLPHSYCYLYDKNLIALHVGSDTAIWLSYVSISVTLAYLVYRSRQEIPFSWMILAFGTFIIACGFTHLMEVVVLWKPLYWLSGDVKLLTAVASVITAITLPPLVPNIQTLIRSSKTAEEYRTRIEATNHELSESNMALQDEVRRRSLVEQRLRAMSARMLQVQDEERRRVAREVHDSAGQMVAALAINMGNLNAVKGTDPLEARIISDSDAILQSLSKELRTISHLLHPPLLDEVGLPSALQWYAEGFTERSKIETKVELDPQVGRLNSDVEIAIFRVVQESLTNVHRHSGSSKARICLTRQGEELVLEIHDNGKGIPPEKQATGLDHGSFGVGLTGMRERVAQLGGTLVVQSSGAGTSVVARFPIGVVAGAHGG
jgi:signal transduction histidine kinase